MLLFSALFFLFPIPPGVRGHFWVDRRRPRASAATASVRRAGPRDHGYHLRWYPGRVCLLVFPCFKKRRKRSESLAPRTAALLPVYPSLTCGFGGSPHVGVVCDSHPPCRCSGQSFEAEFCLCTRQDSDARNVALRQRSYRCDSKEYLGRKGEREVEAGVCVIFLCNGRSNCCAMYVLLCFFGYFYIVRE